MVSPISSSQTSQASVAPKQAAPAPKAQPQQSTPQPKDTVKLSSAGDADRDSDSK